MIYIQSNSEKTRPHHFDAACGMWGAIESGQDYKLTTFDEVKSGKWDALIRKNLFVGSVEFMREVFSRVGIRDVRLPRNSNREFQIMTLGEVRHRASIGEMWFIKPIEIKLFTGFVLDNMIYQSISDIPDTCEVMAYKPLGGIVSEWRVYICDDRIIDIRNYSGDLFKIPNQDYVKSIIKDNGDFPISYTIDVGILETGEEVVIEFNDMWAIGDYGIPNDEYLTLLRRRYFQIMSDNPPSF
jgi:hypothetical protein